MDSAEIRKDGNVFYRDASSMDPNDPARKTLLEKALEHYQTAVTKSADIDEKASALKNAGMAAWKLALAQKELNCSSVSIQKTFQSANCYLKRAETCGSTKSDAWISRIQEIQVNCLEDGLSCSKQVANGRERAALIESLMDVISDSNMKGKCYIAIAQALFYHSVEKLEKEDFIAALSLLHDCHYPVEEACRIDNEDTLMKKRVEELCEDIAKHLIIAEAIQAIKTGDDIYEVAVNHQETLNVDLLWDAIDWYRKALISGRKRDIECEAKALSRLGVVFHDALKMKDKAKAIFMECIKISLTMHPTSPENKDWYQACKTRLEMMQQELLQKEDSLDKELKADILKELKEEISALNSIRKKNEGNDKGLMQDIYAKFPLPDQEIPLITENDTSEDCQRYKKAFLKAILYYDPDKVDTASSGMKCKVLCEEIAKVLNARYNTIKGV